MSDIQKNARPKENKTILKMANYHPCAHSEVTDPDLIGVGYGETPDGEERVCVGLGDGPNDDGNWHSLNLECAEELYRLLAIRLHKK